MNYVFLALTVVCIGGQFTVTKLYQTRCNDNILASFLYSFFSAVLAVLLLAVACRFRIRFTPFSFLTAAGGMLCIVLYTILGMKMMSFGKVAVYTVFIMLGGMFLPFLYGVLLLGEELTVWKIIGVVVLIAALVLTALKKDGERCTHPKLFITLGILVFILNGMVGIFNKVHQISENALSTFEFGFWQNVISAGVLAVVIAVYGTVNRNKIDFYGTAVKVSKQWWIIAVYTVLSQAGSLFQLTAAKTLDASVLFPIVTGGAIFVTAVFGRLFFKEKINALLLVGLILAAGSAVFFVL